MKVPEQIQQVALELRGRHDDFIQKLFKYKIDVPALDLGGGFGLDYRAENKHLDLARVGEGIHDLITEYSFEDKELILELGRFLVGGCGYYLTPIVDIKVSRNRKFILTAGGLNHFRRPVDHKVNHPVTVIPGKTPDYLNGAVEVWKEKADIGGPLCTPRDLIAKDQYLEYAKIGDSLIFGLAGAYGYSSSPVNFLSFPYPGEIYCSKTGYREYLVRAEQ
uniref:Pyridoxal-dependent decarboxylase, pyridoxal binding domain n=1 Tax=Candidatus Kentrum sp. LPFa TaxID=2126335 RepID=A0A450W284_9GAMM|nr:MAG: Pyridoxal-dependent decarboxylase, pyridoxal binding domain [Candidatus Kentron sp. LPFa]